MGTGEHNDDRAGYVWQRRKRGPVGDPVVSTLNDPSGGRDVLLAAAVESATALHAETGAVWVVRYHDINQLAHDPRMVGVGLQLFDLVGIVDGPLRRWYSSLMFINEGAVHVRLRRLVNRAFTPRSIERLREITGNFVGAAFDGIVREGGGDLIDAFGRVPMHVMCRLLGVPEDDVPRFVDWVDALSPTFGFMDPDQIEAASAAIDQLLDYVGTLVSLRRSSPADDLITSLLVAEDTGDRLTHEELVDMVANLLVGGHDTASSQIGCTFLTLLAHPDGLEALGTRPDLVPAAVMETMRFEPSIGAIPRTVVDPLPVGAEERPPGSVVLLSLSAANRDPDVWRDPGAFRLLRFADPDVPKLLSFGTGPHFCLGAHLARMTLQETVRGLIARPLELTGDPQALEWRTVLGRSPLSLEVAVV